MGIKMSKARLITSNEVVLVNDATEEMREKRLLKCYSKFCNAKVTWARISKKNYEIEKKYYRLLVGEKHCDKCPYNTLGQVTIIAKKADNKIIDNIHKGQYEFRLNIVYEALVDRLDEENKNFNMDRINSNNEYKQKKYKLSGKLSPYLSIMNDIMKLREQVENNSELEKIIRIKDRSKRILWRAFYYEIGEEKRLYKYVEKEGYINKNKLKRLKHPVCIEGIIDKEITLNKEDNYFINLKLIKYIKPNEAGFINLYKCTLITKNIDIINSINNLVKKNKKIKIVSYFIPSIKLIINNNFKNYTINGWLNNEQQIYIEAL